MWSCHGNEGNLIGISLKLTSISNRRWCWSSSRRRFIKTTIWRSYAMMSYINGHFRRGREGVVTLGVTVVTNWHRGVKVWHHFWTDQLILLAKHFREMSHCVKGSKLLFAYFFWLVWLQTLPQARVTPFTQYIWKRIGSLIFLFNFQKRWKLWDEVCKNRF